MFATIFLGFVATWSLWSCISLLQNYSIARKIGLPIAISPVDMLNTPWVVINQLFNTVPALSVFRNLVTTQKFLRFSYFGWQFSQGHAAHAEMGPMFTLVTPGSLMIFVADAEAAHNIFTKRKDFIKPYEIYKFQNVFGPHVNSAEGKVWQRHRRLTAPSFNERVSSSVWQESMDQARDMLQSWKSREAGVSTTVLDSATLALNVLTGCGFGVVHKFGEHSSVSKAYDNLSYRDAVMIVMKRFSILLIMPERYLYLSFMPRSIKTIGSACKEFRAHVNTMLIKEREVMKESTPSTANLLTNLINASEAEKAENTSIGLTDEELLGNMFIFTVAGHETTANTTATAIAYLARYPRYQVWLREELQHRLKDQEDIKSGYSTNFPRLKRSLAIMLETLRIHGSIVTVPKTTNDQPQVVSLKGSTYTIPPDTFIFVNNHAIQTDPSIWGPDANEWRPDRWIVGQRSHSDLGSLLDSEEIYEPPPGAFMPWADGPRVCLGKKFSQVEFVAIMATLLLEHEVIPVPQGDKDETNAKLDEMLRDSAILPVTLKMRQPEKVKFTWQNIKPESR